MVKKDEKMTDCCPRNRALYQNPNIYKNLITIINKCKKLEVDREQRNRQKIDEWLIYKNNSLAEDNEDSISTQTHISLYFEKLKKVTELVLDEFEKEKIKENEEEEKNRN